MQDDRFEILKSMKNIAVIGFSPDASKDSFKVGNFLINRGYNVFAVYPRSFKIANKQSVKNINDISASIDTAVVFRKSEALNEIFDEIMQKGVKNLWLQLGIKNDEIAKKARNPAGFPVRRRAAPRPPVQRPASPRSGSEG